MRQNSKTKPFTASHYCAVCTIPNQLAITPLGAADSIKIQAGYLTSITPETFTTHRCVSASHTRCVSAIFKV